VSGASCSVLSLIQVGEQRSRVIEPALKLGDERLRWPRLDFDSGAANAHRQRFARARRSGGLVALVRTFLCGGVLDCSRAVGSHSALGARFANGRDHGGGGGGGGGGGEEESSEYETEDESEEEGAPRVLMKPVFIGAGMRDTIAERDARIAEEEEAKAKREARVAERADESRQLLVQIVQQEEAGPSQPVDKSEFEAPPDDDDEADELEQFERWKVRELRRVKREREEARKEEADKAEIERRRKLTDAERAAEDEEFNQGRAGHGQEKEQWKFLQRYYHKGAYFQDEDETGNAKMGPVMSQDFGAATGRDAVGDKAAMPAPMQVKNFGHRGAVKWTHLSAEDTSSKDALWAADRGLAGKYKQRMAGVKASNDFERPAKRKKPAGL